MYVAHQRCYVIALYKSTFTLHLHVICPWRIAYGRVISSFITTKTTTTTTTTTTSTTTTTTTCTTTTIVILDEWKVFLCFTLRCKSRQLHFVASQLSPSCNGLLVKSISSKDAYSKWSSVSRCHCMQIQVNNRRTEQLCRRCSQTGDFTSGHISNFCSLTSRKVISWRFISPTRNVAWCGRKVKDTCRTATESAHPHL